MSGSRSKKYSLVSSWKKKSLSELPSKVSGYLSKVVRHVWNLVPLTLRMMSPSWGFFFSWGGTGIGVLATGIHPMAAARAKGSHAATPAAMLTYNVQNDPAPVITVLWLRDELHLQAERQIETVMVRRVKHLGLTGCDKKTHKAIYFYWYWRIALLSVILQPYSQCNCSIIEAYFAAEYELDFEKKKRQAPKRRNFPVEIRVK